MLDLRIRSETPPDLNDIRSVNEEAFRRAAEADLVDALRDGGHVLASLVAETHPGVVGHILFSRLPIKQGDRELEAAALAPVAVRAAWQRQGVGSALVRAGIAQCREAAVPAIVVLGHPDYYPRFGFSATLAKPLQAPFSGPAFMALELVPGVLVHGGSVRYPSAFFD